jgi:hypothetical protein
MHHACACSTPCILEYVKALLQASKADSLFIQDNQGKHAMQSFTCTASCRDENKRLPLHHLAANSNILSEKSLQLIVNAYPESITTGNNCGDDVSIPGLVKQSSMIRYHNKVK